MTRLTVQWGDAGSKTPAPWSFAPVRLIGEHVETVLGPGESLEVDDRVIRAIVDVPGFQRYERTIEVALGAEFTVDLQGRKLVRLPGPGGAIGKDAGAPDRTRRLAVSIAPWAGPDVTELSADPTIGLTWAHEGVMISRQSDSALPLAIEIATRFMPGRQLAIPPVGWSDSCTLTWHQTQDSVLRPRVEPSDACGQLLMAYLLAGQYSLAAAAARTIEAARTSVSVIAWSAPSYTQLLIGYAYALGWDTARLLAWCRRTAAADTLGTDGLILEAEAAWQRSSARTALAILIKAAGSVPPTLTFGAEMGLRLASVIPATLDTDSAAGQTNGYVINFNAAGPGGEDLIQIMNDWLRLMTRADAGAASLSTPQTGNTSPDVRGESVLQRFIWLARYALSRWAYDRVLRPGSTDSALRLTTKRRFSMASPIESTPQPNGAKAQVVEDSGRFPRVMTLYISALILAIWVVASIFYATNHDSTFVELIYGSVQAITFAAVGAATVGWILNSRLAAAERRALAAERLAEQFRGDAAKGRALAAALQASDVSEADDFPGAANRRQHAEFARLLYGDLVARSSDKG
ncbi:MAG: hypothetical protein JO023_09555 [Chloroflexi bacterium]|nr:hypothetical protein [Chloroflexota bacterium]